ncbi:MAG: guanylate kinase [Acidobacteria bacterium]|nr:guanylate kinase [Acidobacteriota bacterium]
MSNEPPAARGLLFVISAPSGTGKTTVVARLVERFPRLHRSRSYTSRAPRPGEVEGVDYNFVSRHAFEEMIRRDEFLEWADIFGNLYGTSRRDTEAALAAGNDLVLVIDVQGARQVRSRAAEAVAVFVLPPSYAVLTRRLRGRNQDSETAIECRLAAARAEVGAVDEYDYVVVNDDLERCVAEIDAIVTAERARRSRRIDVIRRIVQTFGVLEPPAPGTSEEQ